MLQFTWRVLKEALDERHPLLERVKFLTDIGFFTCDPHIGADVSDPFNSLTGYSYKREHRKLLVTPGMMRQQILDRIERESEQHRCCIHRSSGKR